MKLALILGAQGEKVKPKLVNVKDNLDIDCYLSIGNFLDSSIKRDLRYDRVITLITLVNKTSIEDLHTYWKKFCPGTDLIFLCRKDVDNDIAKDILKKFTSIRVAVMLVSNTPLQMFTEAVLLDTESITKKYGIEDYLSVESDYDTGIEFVFNEENNDPEKEEPKPVETPKPHVKPPKKSKPGFFSKLFGGKKSQDSVEQQKEEPDKLVPDNENDEEELDTQKQTIHESVSEPIKNEEVTNSQSSEETTEEGVFFGEDTQKEDEEENENTDINSGSGVSQEPTVFKEEINEFEIESVDEDFGSDSFGAASYGSVDTASNAGVNVSEVEEDGGITLASAEESYRKEDVSNVRIVTKEIIKPVRDKAMTSTLAAVLNGKSHKIIVVTGDRGSGVTVTAYSIAKEFAKKVPVLYFDCDIDRHGLLSYIDYESFREYDRSMIEGIKRCRDSSIFLNCVVQYDINLDLLTSDYSCEATDEDIKRAHNVVSENAMNYGVVVVDCPVNKLHLISDLVLIGNTVVCVESSKRGVMNMLCGLEGSPLESRYKRCITSKGMLFMTKPNKRIKSDKVLQYADSIFESNGCDWLHMEYCDFNGNLTTELLANILEG